MTIHLRCLDSKRIVSGCISLRRIYLAHAASDQ